MANMIDLKREKSDKTESALTSSVEQEDYSYGLHLRLDSPEMEKLGITKLSVGDEFEITAKVRVKSFSEDSDDESGERKSTRLLVKAIAMPGERKSAADKLYGGNNG